MEKKPVIGILLEFGFHEIKKYIHSGFAKKLAAHFDIIWFTIDKANKEFDNYFKATGFPIVYFDRKDFSHPDSKTETRNQSVRRHWMIRKDLGAFHNYNKIGNKTLGSRIIGTDLLKVFYERKTLRLVRAKYFSKLIEEALIEHKIDHLFATSYASNFAKYSFVTANRLGIKTWYLVNSWKDLYINNFLPFDFLNGVFVWSEQMKRDYLYHMPYLDKTKIHVSGNPTFDALINSRPHYSRDYYASKYNIALGADWLLYTMMPPGLVNDEIETIILAGKELMKRYTPDQKVIIVRKNPNHSAEEFITIKLPENTVIAEHFCSFDKKQDMIIQSPVGEQEWIDLLHYSVLNLSIPSTVALEFLTLGKPVVNIGFGPDGNENQLVSQHFESGFYRPMFANELIQKCLTLKSLFTAIERSLKMVNKPVKNVNSIEESAVTISEHLLT